MSKIQDERTKLTATFLNGIAISMVVAGAVAPLIAYSYSVVPPAGGGYVLIIGGGWIIGGVTLHRVARNVLKGMSS